MLKAMTRGLMWVMILGVAGVALAQSANSRYEFIERDTVYDTKTDLSWKRCSYGQSYKWPPVGPLATTFECIGQVPRRPYADAQRRAGAGWRLPTKDELATLIDYPHTRETTNPAIDVVAFPNTAKDWYWTSTCDGIDICWFVDFRYGQSGRVELHPHDSPEPTLALRLVRKGK